MAAICVPEWPSPAKNTACKRRWTRAEAVYLIAICKRTRSAAVRIISIQQPGVGLAATQNPLATYLGDAPQNNCKSASYRYTVTNLSTPNFLKLHAARVWVY